MSDRAQVMQRKWPVILRTYPGFRYSPNAHALLVPGGGVLHIFRLGGGQPSEIQTIDLGLSADRPNFNPVDAEWSPDSKRVAVIFSFQIFHGAVVRVYDVATGRMQWERSFDFVEMGGEAWDPSARRLAITLLTGKPNTAYPPRDIPNLLVLDADSGETLLHVTTGDQAGPVCFAPDDRVLTAPLHFRPYGRDRFHHEKAKVWDATTGRRVRQIVLPGRDIHDHLELSQDGRVLLVYVGKEKSGFIFRYLEVTDEVVDRRFQLLEYKSGNVIATSPDLTRGGGCVNHMPSFRLSGHGDHVLVYWPYGGCSPSVFEIQ